MIFISRAVLAVHGGRNNRCEVQSFLQHSVPNVPNDPVYLEHLFKIQYIFKIIFLQHFVPKIPLSAPGQSCWQPQRETHSRSVPWIFGRCKVFITSYLVPNLNVWPLKSFLRSQCVTLEVFSFPRGVQLPKCCLADDVGVKRRRNKLDGACLIRPLDLFEMW